MAAGHGNLEIGTRVSSFTPAVVQRLSEVLHSEPASRTFMQLGVNRNALFERSETSVHIPASQEITENL